MLSKIELIFATVKALWPEGAIWTPAPDEELDIFLKAYAKNWLDAYNTAWSLGNIRDPFQTPLLEELEREFGILQNPDLTEEVRRQQIAGVKYENTDQRNSPDDVEIFLNNLGFDVQVHHNDPAVDPALFPGDILLNGGLYNQQSQYIMQCDGSVAFCGHQDAVCGRFNSFIFTDFNYDIPTDPDLWPFIYFIGGDAVRDGGGFLTSIAPATVSLNRKNKFIEFVLSSKPFFDWAILIINYI